MVSFDVNSDYRIVFEEKQAVTKKGELVAPLQASSEMWTKEWWWRSRVA